jgi:hypothetical protein
MASLAGEWVHADDSSYRYFATDDGGTLTLQARHVVPVDAGFVPRRFGLPPSPSIDAGALRALDAGAHAGTDAGPAPAVPDAGPEASDAGTEEPLESERLPPPAPYPSPTVTLERTTHGFVGQTTAAVMHPAGRECPVTFKTEVVSCDDGGLTLRSESAVVVGELCKAPAHPQPAVALVHRLIRPPSDAGL